MEGATHKFVVDLIKEGGDSLTLTVISVPNYRDQERTENSEDSSGYSNYDYSDRKPLPITVPDYQSVSEGTDKFVVTLLQNYSMVCIAAPPPPSLAYTSQPLHLYFNIS